MKLSSLNNRLPKRALLISAAILYLLSFLTIRYLSVAPTVKNEGKRLEKYIHKQEKDFALFLKDTLRLRRLSLNEESLSTFKEIEAKPYGIFLVEPKTTGGPSLKFWNNQLVLPPLQMASLSEGETFMLLSNGYYLVVKRTIQLADSSALVCYATIPILYKYDYQQSSYLQTHFVYDKNAIKKIAITEKKTPNIIHSIAGKPLFYIDQKTYTPVNANDPLTALLRVLAFVLLMAYIHFVAISFTRKRGPLRGTILLLLALIIVRIVLLSFPDMFSFRHYELFDLKVYSANWLNRSLGDLLINAIFLCWFVVFVWYNIGFVKRLPTYLHGYRSAIVGASALLFLIITTFQLAGVVRSLVADSKISLKRHKLAPRNSLSK